MNTPESRFILSIHRKLKRLSPPPIIRKIADRFTQGWPDVLYIGPSGTCLWVEYKVAPNKPTLLQQEKLTMLNQYQQKTAIITKMGTNCYIFSQKNYYETTNPDEWISTQLGYPYTKTKNSKPE